MTGPRPRPCGAGAGAHALDAVLGPRGRLAAVLPGYEHRPEQLRMAHAVLDALDEAVPLLVEAGTGTGKTLAYLVPAILSGKRVVVSTGTRTLQEQILSRDIPLLQEHLGVPFRAAVLKGVSNYLCRRRLAQIGDTDDPDLLRILAWAGATRTGDRAEAAGVPEDAPAWRLVTTTPEGRTGPRCPFFESCFVTAARRAAGAADLVIVNHHLFFVDLALRSTFEGAQVLPAYDAAILDEAHGVEDVATEHFGVSVSTLRLAALVRDGRRAIGETVAGEALVANLDARSAELFHALRARLDAAQLSLAAPARAPAGGEAAAGAASATGPDGDLRLAAPDDLFAEPTCREAWFRVDAALEELAAHAEGRTALARAGAATEDPVTIARRAEALRADLAVLAEGQLAGRHVRWGEVRGRTVELHASPVDVGPLVRARLVDAVGPVVFTSATLTTGGRFDYVRERLGLDPPEDGRTVELALDSPFDFRRQALLYLPRDLPAPREPGFDERALERVVELVEITAGRALVLFTSHRALRRAARELPRRIAHPVLAQGDGPRAGLLATFRSVVGSVLLATSSFWEGVDVPGEALSLVIVEKLPFAVPDDPITAARVRRCEERGEDPFWRYQLPRAALALKQGFGRLIRRRDDRGIVAILDHRILTRGYGRTFLESLPPAARTSALEQVRRWW